MGLLQDPAKSLAQIDWYLDNAAHELFPGAFELAAGNLCRQTLEQILFVLCCMSGMPSSKYLKGGRTLHTVQRLLNALDQREGSTGRRYWEAAALRGPRVAKFANEERALKRWRTQLNEPSHFAALRQTTPRHLRRFVTRARRLVDAKDHHLVVACANEAFSRGWARVALTSDPDNAPGIETSSVVRASMLRRTPDGKLTFSSFQDRLVVLTRTEVPRGRWPRRSIVLVSGAEGIFLRKGFLTKDGKPVQLGSLDSVLNSLATTEHQARYLVAHLRRLGFMVAISQRPAPTARPEPTDGPAKKGTQLQP